MYLNVPVIVDADTGFGNAVNTYHAVRTLERAGADCIQLEDQVAPKRCGQMAGIKLTQVPFKGGAETNAAVLGQQADALGAMRGWGDTMFGINRTVAQTGESVARQADAARGNARVAAAGAESDARNAAYQQAVDNYRMGLATQTGAGLRAVGDIAKGAGNLGVSYGMNPSGWAGLFGGPAVPASASAVASTGRAAGPV